MVRSILWACVVLLLLVACGSEESDAEGRGPGGSGVSLVKAETGRVRSPDVTDEQVANLVRGSNELAFEMYREQGGSENLVFSPYSISLAFSMAYGGARGETGAQMAQTLNFLPQEGQHPAFNALDRRVSQSGSEAGNSGPLFQLNVANAVWGQRGYPFEGAYLDTLARHYGAGLQTVDFGQTEAATEEINGWIAGETEGRIEDLLAPGVLDPDTRMVLTNAIYFKSSWATKFEKSETEDGPFTLPGGEEVAVPMMRQKERLSYAEGADYQAMQLPYEGYAADMLIILPAEGSFGRVEERLGADLLDELYGKLSDHPVTLTMPRFAFEEKLDLIDLLKGIGLRLPFHPYEADFSGVTKKERLHIYKALHRATIAVDEKGTEATAATAISDMPVSGMGPPVTMTLDRPFIFAIREQETGAILFLGRVTDPQS